MFKNLSAKYYQKNKVWLQKKLVKDINKKQKRKNEKKQQYGFERYKDLSKDGKQKFVEYRKSIIEWQKRLYYNYEKVF